MASTQPTTNTSSDGTSTPRPKLTSAHLVPASDHSNAGSSSEHTPTDTVNYKARGLKFFSRPHDDKEVHDDKDDKKDQEDKEDKYETEFGSLAGSWWGDRKESTRPWRDPPKRRNTIPPDQTVAFERTKAAVRRAAGAVLRNVPAVAHEALIIAADALEVAPVIGLAEAARVLLSIWDSVEAVETNRLSCLRLTERCATILYSIRSEIDAAGTDVANTLQEPVAKLTESFRRVEHFIQKQVARPFLKRYLKRDEDARRIMACDTSLTDSVGLFSVAIQMRMLKELQAQSHYHAAAAAAATTTTVTKPPATPLIPAQPKPEEILAAIATIRAAQAANDAALDTADLYASMRAALRTGSDVAMLDVLQINRGEMAEGIKTLQRALEDPRLTPGRSGTSSGFHFKTDSGETNSLQLSRGVSTTRGAPSTPSTGSSSSQYAWISTAHTPMPTPAAWDPEQDAAFHREFLESGLDALRRVSGAGGGDSLPPWTITRWEVDREGRIGVGYFSDVFKGVWRGRQVAIKILAPTTPRKLFRHETTIWTSLKHPFVLELLGASSAAGDPPWFFVSPYMKNGTLVSFLKGIAAGEMGVGKSKAYPGPLQMMHEIAVGMAYLHRKGVLHGDLKANNVLIDDDLHCVISDFGQSELKSEVYRLSHQPQPHGTLRWQAPEIMSGESRLTTAVDVYAFAIVCVEILTYGELPWALLDDQAVQQLVLGLDKRPQIPLRPETSLSLITLIRQCWSKDPTARPAFDSVARGLGHLIDGLRGTTGGSNGASPSPRGGKALELIREEENGGQQKQHSPDMAPVNLPRISQESVRDVTEEHRLPASTIPLQRVVTPSSREKTVAGIMAYDHPLLDEETEGKQGDVVGSRGVHSRAGSDILTSTPEGSSEADYQDVGIAWDGYASPRPIDDRLAVRRDERRYRLLLQHEFNPSLNLPLWEPSPVRVGAVGYLAKPAGAFVTLFNAYNPSGTGDGRAHGLASIYGYGRVREVAQHQDRRSVAQKGLDIIQGLLTFTKKGSDTTVSKSVSRRHSFPLRAGHKHAYLCTENTTYRYMVEMDAAKAWFKANIKEIVRLYGYEHQIQREDVFLVIGTLETRDYGLFVSHEHPDGQVHFNVFTDRREGQDWGLFSTDSDVGVDMPGPSFDKNGEDASLAAMPSVHASKISRVRAGSDPDADAVLLARLRFKPDVDEPTRL